MRTYTRELAVETPTDVLVIGSGPAGLAAAVAAAREGKSVRLVERYGYLGGNLTGALVGPCMTSFSLDGKTQLIRGIFDEFVRNMEKLGGAVHPSHTVGGSPYSGFMTYGHEAVTPFDPEVAKRVASEIDRKSTRLNSSHVAISYAVFCWKKKIQKRPNTNTRSTQEHQ